MTDIFERIVAAQEKFKTQSINPPNVIYMNMADYRALCDWAEQQSIIVSNDTCGIYGEVVTPINQKPIEILGMRIRKRSGAGIECDYSLIEAAEHPKNIVEKIIGAGNKFVDDHNRKPNILYLNDHDWNQLCTFVREHHVDSFIGTAINQTEIKIDNATLKPYEILGMRIVKKAGANLECEYNATQPPKDYMTVEAVRKCADSIKAIGTRLPVCDHGLVRAYCPNCARELLKQFNQNVLKPELKKIEMTIDDINKIRKMAR